MEIKNRFTDINKWDDPFFHQLSLKEKVLWLYIQDACSPIGVYRHYLEKVSFATRIPESELPNLDVFNKSGDKLLQLSHLGEEFYLIADYVKCQYVGKKGNGLSITNAPHYGYLNEIREKGLWEYFIDRGDIADNSIIYFHEVDAGNIRNEKKPTSEFIKELTSQFNSSLTDSTKGKSKPFVNVKDKEKKQDRVKEKNKENKVLNDEDFRELITYLNPILKAEDTLIFTFEEELRKLIDKLSKEVMLVFPAIKNIAEEMRKELDRENRTFKELESRVFIRYLSNNISF